jgi:hypothetical protein
MVFCVGALACLAPIESAQSILSEIHGGVDAAIGGYVAAVGDIDGDKVTDFAVNDSSFGAAGAVDIFSGRTSAVLHQFVAPAQFTGFGYPFCGGGDVNADGVPDIIVAAPLGFGATGNGAAFVYSGSDFSLLWTHTGVPKAELGYSLAIIGDVNGDAHADYAITSSNMSFGGSQIGKVSVFSGSTGQVLYEIRGSTPATGFGFALGALGDVTGDGVPDLAVGEPVASSPGFSKNGAARIYSGVNGAHVRSIVGESDSAVMGWSIASLGDLTGDDRAEIAVSVFSTTFLANGVAVFSATDGAKLGEEYGDVLDAVSNSPSVSALSDADGDGKTDLMFIDRSSSKGQVIALSSATMERLYIRKSPLPSYFFPAKMADLGDVNGDSFPDFVVGDPAGTPPGLQNTGAAWIFTCRPLLATPPTLSAGGRGSVSLDVAPGVGHAGATYAILGSLTPEAGGCGGFDVGPSHVHVPFCFDILTDLSITLANSSVFQATYGELEPYTAMAHAMLDATGVTLPVSAVGIQMWFFALTKARSGGAWDNCWEAVSVEITP